MAGGTGDVLVAAQDSIEEQQLTQSNLLRGMSRAGIWKFDSFPLQRSLQSALEVAARSCGTPRSLRGGRAGLFRVLLREAGIAQEQSGNGDQGREKSMHGGAGSSGLRKFDPRHPRPMQLFRRFLSNQPPFPLAPNRIPSSPGKRPPREKGAPAVTLTFTRHAGRPLRSGPGSEHRSRRPPGRFPAPPAPRDPRWKTQSRKSHPRALSLRRGSG